MNLGLDYRSCVAVPTEAECETEQVGSLVRPQGRGVAKTVCAVGVTALRESVRCPRMVCRDRYAGEVVVNLVAVS